MADQKSTVSQGVANTIIRALLREKLQNSLNGVFLAIGEVTKDLFPAIQAETKLELLIMAQDAIIEIMEEQKRRVQNRIKSFAEARQE